MFMASKILAINQLWFIFPQTNLKISGNIEATLTYKMPETLFVTVHKGNNFTNAYEGGAPNPTVKLQIPGIQSVFETKVNIRHFSNCLKLCNI